ncbi:MAG: hypothetical protein ACI84E_002160 [Planctomycetota bacterium]|jgi:hypothetical protein
MTRNSLLLLILLLAFLLVVGGVVLMDGSQHVESNRQRVDQSPDAGPQRGVSAIAPLILPAVVSSAPSRAAEFSGLPILVELGDSSQGQDTGKWNKASASYEGVLFSVSGAEGQALAMFLAMPHSQELPNELLATATRHSVTAGEITVVPSPDSLTLFVATFGDAVGAVLVDPALTGGASRLTLTALRPRLTRVQVIRENKAPQPGARVVLRGIGVFAGKHETEFMANSKGRTSFYHIGALSWHGVSDWTWDVQALWGQSKSLREEAEEDEKRGAPLILTLKDGVDVIVLFEDERGRSVVNTLLRNEYRYAGHISGSGGSKKVLMNLQEGQVVQVQSVDDERRNWVVEPTSFVVASGEEPTQTVHLRARFKGFTLTGSLLHEDWTVFAEGEFTLWSDYGWPDGKTLQSPLGTYTTDEQGTFAIPIELRHFVIWDDMPTRMKFDFRYLRGQKEGLSVKSFDVASTLSTSAEDGGQEVELGDLFWRKPRTLFRGRVVDPMGIPVEGATVQANASREALKSARPDVRRDLGAISRRGSLKATTDSLGQFELAYDAPPGFFQIMATHHGASTEYTEVEGPRSEEVLLTLQRSGSLMGSLAPSWKGVQGWSVKVIPVNPEVGQVFAPKTLKKQPKAADEYESTNAILLGPPWIGLDFGWVWIPVGTYDLVFSHDSLLPGEEYSIRGVEVTAGVQSPDARLKEIDLDAVKPTVTIELTRPDGPAISKQSRTEYILGSGTMLESHKGRRGSSYSFLPTALPVALRIETQGFEPVDLMAEGGVIKVSLVPLGD